MKSPKPAEVPWNLPSLLAVAFPLGLMPKAPGTWGSLPGILVAYGLAKGSSALLPARPEIVCVVGLLLLTALAWWSIDRTEKLWSTHDDGSIVIDEVLGQAIALVFFPFDTFHIILGFVLFRIFDIFKPGPIGWADEKLPGAWGTLLDDVIAGIFAGLCLWGVSAALGSGL